jgi:hypothetical protein
VLTVLTAIAIVATAAACGFALLAWAQHRDAQRRSAARVAALSAAIDGREPARTGRLPEGDLARPAAPLFAIEPSSPRRWMIAAGILPVVLIVAALLVTRGPRSGPPPALHQPESLELLAMHHDTTSGALTVTGTVRVRGRDTPPVTAVVTGRDADGRVVASAHAPLEDAHLDLDGESSFQVAVPGHDVRRYQVRFETPLGPLTHIDRRGTSAAPALP